MYDINMALPCRGHCGDLGRVWLEAEEQIKLNGWAHGCPHWCEHSWSAVFSWILCSKSSADKWKCILVRMLIDRLRRSH